ncbi:MAG: squalene/phytoene synthase family protein [Pseudolabrys sp.]
MITNAEHCANLVHEADRDRYLAALFASEAHRDALLALYAFNVEIARVRDLAREPMPGEIRLQWWREALAGERDAEAAAHPVAASLREALARHGLSADPLQALIDAHTFDLYDEPMASLRDFDDYAAKTRGAVFALAAAMLGGLPPEVQALSRHAGIAYTVAGLLANLPLHAARRQLYVPLELLRRHGVTPEAVFAREDSEGLHAALAGLRAHAREHLTAARGALPSVPPAALPALLSAATVGAALKRGEGGDPFQPQPLSLLKRQWLLWCAAHNPKRIFQG